MARIADEVRRAHSDPQRGPVITAIDYTIDHDWSGEEAVHFTVTTADPDGREFFEHTELSPISEQISDLFHAHGIARIPYVVFRLESEARAIANNTYFADE